MASTVRNLDYNIRFKVDKSNFNEIQSALRAVINTKIPASGPDPLNIKTSVEAAKELENLLSASWNHKLNQLDVSKFNNSVKESFGSVEQLRAKLVAGGEQGAIAFNKIATSVLTSNTQLKQSNKLLDSMAQSFKNTIKWQISSKAINTIVGGIRQAYNYTKNLDTSLNNIMIVTGKNADQMERFAVSANRVAQSLATSTLDYTNASLIYYQQGLSDEEVAARTETTLKTANVTGQTAAEVSEQLTAVWNGYKVAIEESELYIDKLAAVAASTASDLQELSTGMSKVASTANAMGVDIDQLTAQLSTIVSVTRQAPESVGNALKTIYARMGDLKIDGVDEFGVGLGDVSSQLQAVGVQVLDAQGNLRDLGDVTEEVAAKWQTWTQAQQQAVAIALAGKRQYNNLIALFENWQMYESAMVTAANAAGTLNEQQEIYLESTRAHLQRLSTEAQRTYDIVFNPQMINTWAKILKGALDIFNDFTEGLGGGTAALTVFGSSIVSLFSHKIAQAIVQTNANLQTLRNNMLLVAQQAVWANNIDANSTYTQRDQNNHYLSNAQAVGAKAAAEAYQKIYEVRKGLNAEQQRSAIHLSEQIAALERKKYLMDQSLNILTQYNLQYSTPKETQIALEDYSKMNQQLSKMTQSLAQIDLMRDNQQNDLAATKQAYIDVLNIIKQIHASDIGSGAATAEQLAQVENLTQAYHLMANNSSSIQVVEQRKNILLEFAKKVYEENLSVIQRTNVALSEQQNIQKGVQTATTGALEMNKAKLDSLVASGEKTQNIGTKITNISTAVSIASSAIGSLTGVLDQNATAAEKTNAAWGVLNAAAAGIGMAFGGPMGAMLGRGIASVVQQLLNLVGLEDEIESFFSSAEERIAKVDERYNKLTSSIRGFRSEQEKITKQMNSLPDLVKEYNKLSNLAGDYDKDISTLTDSQRQKYNSLKEQLAEIDQTLVRGYTTEGELILSNNLELDKQIQKLQRIAELKKNQVYNDQTYQELVDTTNAEQRTRFKNLGQARSNIRAFGNSFNRRGRISQAIQKSDASQETQDYLLNLWDKSVDNQNIQGMRKVLDTVVDYVDLETEYGQKIAQLAAEWEKEIVNLERVYTSNEQFFQNRPEELSQKYADFFVNLSSNKKTVQKLGEIGLDENLTKQLYQNFMRGLIINADSLAIEDFDEEIAKSVEIIMRKIADGDIDISHALLSAREAGEEFSKEYYSNYAQQFAKYESIRDSFRSALADSGLTTQDIDALVEGTFGNLLNTQKIDNMFTELGNKLAGESTDSLKNKLNAEQAEKIVELGRKYGEFIYGAYDDTQQLLTLTDRLNANYSNIENIGNLTDILSSGGTLGEEQLKHVKELETEYQWLGQIQNKNSHAYISALRDIRQIEEDNRRVALQAEREILAAKEASLRKQIQEYEFLFSEEQLEFNVDYQQLQSELQNTIQAVFDKTRQIKASVDLDLATDVENAFGLANELGALQKMIGDTLIISFDQAQQLIAQGYGEILTNARQTAEQSIELNDATVNAFLTGKQAEIQADKESKIQQLTGQKEILNTQLSLLQAQYDAFAAVKKATTDAERKEALLAAINAEEKYQATVLGLQAELEAQDKKAAQQAALVKKMYDSLGIMYEEDSANQVNAHVAAEKANQGLATTMINNFQSVHTAATSVANAVAAAGSGKTPGKFKAGPVTGGKASVKNAKSRQVTAFGPQEVGKIDAKENFIQQTIKNGSYNDLADAMMNNISSEMQNVRNQIGSIDAGIAALKSASSSFQTYKSGLPERTAKAKEDKAGKGSSEKQKQAQQMELLDEQVDIYHDINIQLEKYAKAIDRIQKAQNKLVGKELVNALKDQENLLNKQIELYNVKQKIMLKDLADRKATLMANGAIFDSESQLLNHSTLLANKQAEINALISRYNNMSAEQQEVWKDHVNAKKEQYKILVDYVSEYEDLLNNEFEEIIDQLDEIKDRKIEIQIKKFNTELDVRLNMAQAEKDWSDFRRRIQKQILDDDFLELATDKILDFDIYYNTHGAGAIQDLTDHVNRIMRQGDIMQATGWSEVYGDNMVRLLEDLKNYNDQLMSSLEEVEDLVDDINSHYLDMIDKSKNAFDKQIKTYQQIDKIIGHNINVLEKVYGENTQYDSILKYYETREQNNNQQLDFLRQQTDLWQRMAESEKARLATMREGTKEWENSKKAVDKYVENWENSLNDLNSKIESSIENLVAKWKSEIDQIVVKSQDAIFGGDMDKALGEWEHMVWFSKRYLDDLTRASKLIELDAKYQEAIDNSEDVKTQSKLQQLRDYEIKRLQQKVNLRQIDIDIAEKQLALMLKSQAVQQAQRAKTKMRLRRDSQGNYRYEYVADDENAKEELQEEYARIEELRMLIKNDWIDTTSEVSSMIQKMYKEMADAAYKYQGDQQATQKAIKEIYHRYMNPTNGYITSLVRDAQQMEIKLNETTMIQLKQLRDQYGKDFYKWLGLDEQSDGSIIKMINDHLDEITKNVSQLTGEGIPTLLDWLKDGYLREWYSSLSDINKTQIMSYILPPWETAVGNIIQLFDDRNNGLAAIVEKSMDNIINVTYEYVDSLYQLETLAGISFWQIGAGIDNNIYKTQQLLYNNNELINSYQQEMYTIQRVVDSLRDLVSQFNAARQAAIDAAEAASRYYAEVARQSSSVPQVSGGSASQLYPTLPSPSSSGGSSSSGGGSSYQPAPQPVTNIGSQKSGTSYVVYNARRVAVMYGPAYYDDCQAFVNRNCSYEEIQADAIRILPWDTVRNFIGVSWDSQKTKVNNATSRLKTVWGAAYATGGYTGEWGSEGRIAILHEKELVLNEADTENILGAVNIMRGITNRLNLAAGAMSFGRSNSVLPQMINNNNSNSQQAITIYADFPAANSAAEIEAAFNNMVNMASQRASKNRRSI